MAEDQPPNKIDPPTPYALASVICDQIYRDAVSGRYSILGIFSGVRVESFPVTIRMAAYVALTDGRGRTPIKLRIVDAEEEREPILQAEAALDFADPRMIFEGFFDFGGVQFPDEGEYRLQLFSHGELLMERKITLLMAKQDDAGN